MPHSAIHYKCRTLGDECRSIASPRLMHPWRLQMQIHKLLTPNYLWLYPYQVAPTEELYIKSESNADIFPTSNIHPFVERFTCQALYKIKLVCRTKNMTALLTSSQQDSKMQFPRCYTKMTGSPGQTRPLMCISITSSWWGKICQLIFLQILVCTFWFWVS